MINLGQNNSDNNNQMITKTSGFYIVTMVNGISKCDHIKWLITLTSNNIKWLSMYLEFEDFFSKKEKNFHPT